MERAQIIDNIRQVAARPCYVTHQSPVINYDITIYGTYATTIDAISNVECKINYYSLDGQPIEQPRKGLNIVKMSDGTVKKVVVK